MIRHRTLGEPEAVARARAAWRLLRPGAPEPAAVDVLSRKKKSTVCRLLGPAEAGFPVVAKRARRPKVQVERTLYEGILPRLPVSTLDCYGMVEEEGGEFGWLFLEDAGDAAFVPGCQEHRVLAAGWLGVLHTIGLPVEDAPELRESGAGESLEQLRLTRQRILANAHDPVLVPANRADLDTILRRYDAIERNWPECEALCAAIPRSLVHGDLAKKNMRVRERDGSLELLILDWEHAGVGFPGVDLFVADPDRYASAVRAHWRVLDDATLARLFRIGRLFRLLRAIDWESRCLGRPAGQSREVGFVRLSARLDCVVRESGWAR